MKVRQWMGAAVLMLAVPAFAAAQSGSGGASGSGASGSGSTATGSAGGASTDGIGTTGGRTAGGRSDRGTPGAGDQSTNGSGSGAATATTGQAGATGTTSGQTTTSSAATTSGFGTDTLNHWYASGFVGSDFGAQANGSNVDFGASVGYMWNSAIGAEFLAGFTPDFDMQNNVLLAEQPQVNSYMFNAIGSVPIGSESQWQPFVSGGFGAITLRSDLLNTGTTGNAVSDTFNPDDTRFGGNIGAGVMGFVGGWGVRADVRYFRASSGTDTSTNSTTNPIASSLLSGLDFWRANIGVAFRW